MVAELGDETLSLGLLRKPSNQWNKALTIYIVKVCALGLAFVIVVLLSIQFPFHMMKDCTRQIIHRIGVPRTFESSNVLGLAANAPYAGFTPSWALRGMGNAAKSAPSVAQLEAALVEIENSYTSGQILRGTRVRKSAGELNHVGADPFLYQHQGGDRMSSANGKHGYAHVYAQYLHKIIDTRRGWLPTNIVEVGVFKGTGLALWSTLFPESRVYGFDLDLANYYENLPRLKQMNYDDTNVTVHTMDQYLVEATMLEDVLSPGIELVIDDGCHTPTCALNTFRAMYRYLAPSFLYIIEDNAATSESARSELALICPQCQITSHGELTIITQ